MTNPAAAFRVADRPLPVIDILDASFAVLRHRPRVIFLSVLWIVAPLALLENYLSRDALGGNTIADLIENPTLLSTTESSYGSTYLLYIIEWARISLIGVSIGFLIHSWGEGRDPKPVDVIRFTARKLPLWLACFTLMKVISVFTFWTLVPFIAFALASPIIAIEGGSPFGVLRRSFSMMRMRTGQLIGLYAAAVAVTLTVNLILQPLPLIVAGFLGPDISWPLLGLSSLLITSLVAPFNAAAMTLFYFDVRFRMEGLDIQQRADRLFSTPSEILNG